MSHAAGTKKTGSYNHGTSQTPAIFAADMLSQIKNHTRYQPVIRKEVKS